MKGNAVQAARIISRPKFPESSGVKCSIRFPEHDYLLQLEPTENPNEIFLWAQKNKKFIKEATLAYGGILFHGFDFDISDFKKLVECLSPEPGLEYLAGPGPREKYMEDVYVSTYVPPAAVLAQHHEMAYFTSWPMKVFFYCDIAPIQGGETLICSSRHFQSRLDAKILKRFHDRRVLYVRNYEAPTDFDTAIASGWQLSFGTKDKSVVESICKDMKMTFEWRGDSLRTRNIAQGAANHPETGELFLHNQAYLRTLASDAKGTMTPAVRMFAPGLASDAVNAILTLGPEEQSTNAFYADDASLIEQSILEELHEVFSSATVSFPWKKGDFVMLDNMLSYHGRNAFEGKRRILTVIKEKENQG